MINDLLHRRRDQRLESLVTIDAVADRIDCHHKITKMLVDHKSRQCLLVKTMEELLDATVDYRGELQNVETWFWDLTESNRKRQLLVECAIEGFEKAGNFTLLADGMFTLDQIVEIAPNAETVAVPGVYARLYLAKRKSALYVGSSGNIMGRMESHNYFLPKCYTMHSRAHKRAIRKHLVLCDLDGNVYAQQDENVRLVIEQLLIIVFGDYATSDLGSFIARREIQTSMNDDF